MANKYVPIEFELIAEGEALSDLNREIRTAVSALHNHQQRCARVEGGRSPLGAKAVVTMKITFQQLTEAADIKFEVSSKLPPRPAHVTTAAEGVDDDGKHTLMVPRSGTTADDPRQGRLATHDGRAVDLETGEPREPVAPLPGGKRPHADRKSASAGE